MSEEKKRYTIKVESFVDRYNSAGEQYAGDHETVYEQTVESLNLQAVIAAVNAPDEFVAAMITPKLENHK